MGKVSPDNGFSKTSKQKRRLRSSVSKYLKPGALAQLRYNKTAASSSSRKSCTDLGKKRVGVYGSKKVENHDLSIEVDQDVDKSPLVMSPVGLLKQSCLIRTPKTPRNEIGSPESRLESLPMDLLVKILCHLHHDQLRVVFHVSKRVRNAASFARQFYFNYTTPDRSRQEMLSTMTPRPTEHWPFVSKGDGKSFLPSTPNTPKAPRHGPRPPSRLKFTEVKQIAAVLFPDSAFPKGCMVPSALPKPLCKSLASNRVLFCEDELCQAVAQNKLL